jgi:hypothetical protein
MSSRCTLSHLKQLTRTADQTSVGQEEYSHKCRGVDDKHNGQNVRTSCGLQAQFLHDWIPGDWVGNSRMEQPTCEFKSMFVEGA